MVVFDKKSLFLGVQAGKKWLKKCVDHYTYDIHGNVKSLVQDNKSITVTGQRFKRIDYDYDLISGKVNKINYQPNAPDQFIHKLTYDGDNKITKVETSTDDIIYQTDAKYFYYPTGELSRVEYGKNQVQGVDYAYTLQGWIKGVNSTTLNEKRDIGKDADTTSTNPNKYFARDAMGYALGYYENDYKPIDHLKWNTVTNRFEAKTVGSQMEGQRYDLHNGNISSMVTTLTQRDTTGGGLANAPVAKPIANAYKYDQANRLVKSLGFSNIDIPNNLWNSSGQAVNNMYENTFAYDANGNIRKQKRYDSAGVKIEDMTYRLHYDANGKLVKNRLYHINDVVSSGVSSTDIDDQGTFDSIPSTDLNVNNNYRYDEVGNLKRDAQEQIDTIKWMLNGKIKEIKRTAGSSKKNIKFDYDARGNRVAKHVYSSAGVWQYSIYYIWDAQGSVMSTYDNRVISSVMSFKLEEQHIYGGSRIGMVKPNIEMIGADTTNEFLFDTLNKRQYELANHLGSVLTTVFDRKIAVDTNSDKTIDFRVSDIASAGDYSPTGVKLTGRGFTINNYRAGGFNGKEKLDELHGNSGDAYDYGARMYDPRVARFVSIDPFSKSYPHFSTYQYASNNPILNIDVDGLEGADYLKNTFLMSTGKPRFAKSDAANTAKNPVYTFMIDGAMYIQHQEKLISFNPSSAPTMLGMIGTGFQGAAAKGFSKDLLNFADNTVPAIVSAKTGQEINSVKQGFANTFRHQAWQSLLTIAEGSDFAKKAGDYHERDGILNAQKGAFAKDNLVDLINNEYGRDYAKNFKLSDVSQSVESFTNYLNGLSQHLASTVDGYKDDKSFESIRTGETKLFDSNSKDVQNLFESFKSMINTVHKNDESETKKP